MKILAKRHDMNVQSDTLLLADVFNKELLESVS